MKLINALEPEWYLSANEKFPPQKFTPGNVGGVSYFLVHFDLLTTLEPGVKKWLSFIAPILPKPKTLFLGPTISEYFSFPSSITDQTFIVDILQLLKSSHSSAIIFKDLPTESPLLSGEENIRSAQLTNTLTQQGFEMVTGEAIAYVPIDFASTKEFMSRFPGNRRRKIQANLRSGINVVVEEKSPGPDAPLSDAFIDKIYKLYSNVFDQSPAQFDKLTKEFFTSILQNGQNEGRLFLYFVDSELIGFTYNLVNRDVFISKYIGFDYSKSREYSLYYISWFHMLEYCLKHKLKIMIASKASAEMKAYLGAKFTYTQYAVYFKNPLLRWLTHRLKHFFESDKAVLEKVKIQEQAKNPRSHWLSYTLLWLALVTSDTSSQIFIKIGAVKSATNHILDWHVALGYGFVITSFLIWMQILKSTKLSIALSATAINYITVALASHYLLGEALSPFLIIGCILIGAGVFILGQAQTGREL